MVTEVFTVLFCSIILPDGMPNEVPMEAVVLVFLSKIYKPQSIIRKLELVQTVLTSKSHNFSTCMQHDVKAYNSNL